MEENHKETKACCDSKTCCSGKEMNFGSLFLGLMVVFFGLVFLGKNAGFILFQIPNLTADNLWPLLAIFLGLSILNAKNIFAKIGGFIFTLAIVFICLGLIFGQSIMRQLNLSPETINLESEIAPGINGGNL